MKKTLASTAMDLQLQVREVQRIARCSPVFETSAPRELHGWAVECGVTCVVCPGCAFTFDAQHEDDTPDGGYSCPSCHYGVLDSRIAADAAATGREKEAGQCRDQ